MMLMRKSLNRSEKDMNSKSFFSFFFNILSADTQQRIWSLSHKCLSRCSRYFILSSSFSLSCAALRLPSSLAVYSICASLSSSVNHVNVLRQAHWSALVCEKQHVPCGWRLLKFSVQWSAPVLLAGCVKHIKGSQQGWLMTRFPPLHVPLASFNSLPLSLPSYPSFLLGLGISLTPCCFFYSPTFFSISFPPSCKRCGWMPIILLSDRKTSQDSGHYIFMWYEAHNINYSSLSTHTNTACLCVHTVHIPVCKCMHDQLTWLC